MALMLQKSKTLTPKTSAPRIRQRRPRAPRSKRQPQLARVRRPRANKRKNPPSKRGSYAMLSTCARDYAHCLADPFDGPLGCIPDFPALNTRRSRVYARGTGSTGTNGIGFVVACPNNGIAGDDSYVASSTSAYTLATFPVNFTEAGVAISDSNSDYTAAQLASGATLVRTVSCGLRVRFTGTEYARGGEIYALQEPSHYSLAGMSTGVISSYDEFKRFAVDREWKTVLFTPVDLADNSFNLYANVPLTGSNGAFMGFMIVAPSSDAETFSWEAFSVIELNGRNIRGKTPSHFDPAGYAAVQAATALSENLRPSTLPGPVRALNHIASATKVLNETASGIGSNVSSILNTASQVGNAVSGIYGASNMIGKAGGVASSMLGTATKIGAIQSGSSSAASTMLSLLEDGGEDVLRFLPSFAAMAL
jgi:hypothetical protein